MTDSTKQPSGAQQTVRMVLAAALHHSAGHEEKMVELQQYAGLRGQKTGARAKESAVHEKNDAPRRQNAPHPGERPGSLFDRGLQRSDRSLRRSAGDSLPTLALPSLAGSEGEEMGSSGGRVHRDTATIIRCICDGIWTNTSH